MVAHAWQLIIVALMSLSMLMGCASSPYVGTGAALGGGLGAIAGAAIGNRNPWAGALIGGLAGSALGAGGGYLMQQRQQQQQYGPPQGYYPPQPGYGAPAPPAYGRYTPEPGPRYGYNAPAPAAPQDPSDGWVNTAPAAPSGTGYDNGAAPPAYSQAPQARDRAPVTPGPYIYQQGGE